MSEIERIQEELRQTDKVIEEVMNMNTVTIDSKKYLLQLLNRRTFELQTRIKEITANLDTFQSTK